MIRIEYKNTDIEMKNTEFEIENYKGKVEFFNKLEYMKTKFMLKLEKPIKLDSVFETHQIIYKNNKPYSIFFCKYTEMARKFNKIEVLIPIPEEILLECFNVEKDIENKIKQKNLTQDIEIDYIDHIHSIMIKDIVDELKENYPKYIILSEEEIARELAHDIELEKNYKNKLIPNKIIREKITKILDRESQKEIEYEKQKEDKINNLLKIAMETGEPQLISQWVEDCNDPSEECNADICSYWILPDGTKKETRSHTY